tara:strand:- start:8743 stop:9162 length:420 start_codon:yes stop_codon:yes gene_type:complete
MAIGLATNTVQTGGGTVSAGTNITGFSGKVVYDKGITQTPTPRVLSVQFGDGYEMRVRDGINNTPRSWGLTFNNRTKEDIDKLYKFINTLASVDTAKLTVPNSVDGEETVTVVLEGYSRVLSYDSYYSLTCTAREVFEP